MVNLSSLAGGMAGGAAITIVIKAIDDYSKETDKAKKNILGMSKGTTIALAGIATAAVLVGKGILDLSMKAAEFNDRLDAFKSLTGDLYAPMLTSLKSATYGTISSMDLITSANQAMIMGVDKEALPDMFNAAKIMADSAGKSTIEVINDLASGIGKQNERVLKSYGIFFDAEKVYEDYAKSIGKTSKALTESEKKTAFSIAAMKSLSEQTQRLGGYSEDLSDKVERLKASWEDYKIQLGESTSGVLPATIDHLNALLVIMGDEDQKVSELIKGYGILDAVMNYHVAMAMESVIKEREQTEATDILARALSGAELNTKDFGIAQGILEGQVDDATDALEKEKKKLNAIGDEIDALLGGQTEDEIKASGEIGAVQAEKHKLELTMAQETAEKRAEFKAQGISDIDDEISKWQSTDSPYLLQQAQMDDLDEKENLLRLNKQVTFDDTRDSLKNEDALYRASGEGLKKNMAEVKTALIDLHTKWRAELDLVIAKQQELINKQRESANLKPAPGQTAKQMAEEVSKETGVQFTYETRGTTQDYVPGMLAPGYKFNDFISRPGQSPVSFSSDDFIIGTKNPAGLGGGTTIIIEGNIYGVDPDQISEALYNRLSEGIKY